VRSRLLRYSRQVENSLTSEEGDALGDVLAQRIEGWRKTREE
jgi:hypothetical protein